MVPRNDTLKTNAHYLFVNKLIIAMLYYVAFDRFPYRAEWLPHTDIQARLCSRNGSVMSTKSYGTELLPRGDIWPRVRLGRLHYTDLLPNGKRASGVRNVVITRRHHKLFHYLCGYASYHLLIVRGNCEAFCDRGWTMPWLSNTIITDNNLMFVSKTKPIGT